MYFKERKNFPVEKLYNKIKKNVFKKTNPIVIADFGCGTTPNGNSWSIKLIKKIIKEKKSRKYILHLIDPEIKKDDFENSFKNCSVKELHIHKRDAYYSLKHIKNKIDIAFFGWVLHHLPNWRFFLDYLIEEKMNENGLILIDEEDKEYASCVDCENFCHRNEINEICKKVKDLIVKREITAYNISPVKDFLYKKGFKEDCEEGRYVEEELNLKVLNKLHAGRIYRYFKNDELVKDDIIVDWKHKLKVYIFEKKNNKGILKWLINFLKCLA